MEFGLSGKRTELKKGMAGLYGSGAAKGKKNKLKGEWGKDFLICLRKSLRITRRN